MTDLPPRASEGRDDARRLPPPPPPPVPTPPPPPPPPSAASPTWPAPPGSRPGRGFPWKVVGILVAVVVIAVVIAGVLVARFVGDSGFTAHVDRANQYLDALRVDPQAAAAMRCPGAEDWFADLLSSSSGQYLSTFQVADGQGEVSGTIDFPDGSTATVVVVTQGPAFPSGDDPAAEVCILSTHLP